MPTSKMASAGSAEAQLPFEERGRVTPEKVERVVRRVVEMVKPTLIVAFGSRARGTHHPDSDLDIEVILRDFDKSSDPAPIHRGHLDVWMSVDMLVIGEERYEFMKDSIISVHYDIANEGIVLYDERIGSINQGAVERVGR